MYCVSNFRLSTYNCKAYVVSIFPVDEPALASIMTHDHAKDFMRLGARSAEDIGAMEVFWFD